MMKTPPRGARCRSGQFVSTWGERALTGRSGHVQDAPQGSCCCRGGSGRGCACRRRTGDGTCRGCRHRRRSFPHVGTAPGTTFGQGCPKKTMRATQGVCGSAVAISRMSLGCPNTSADGALWSRSCRPFDVVRWGPWAGGIRPLPVACATPTARRSQAGRTNLQQSREGTWPITPKHPRPPSGTSSEQRFFSPHRRSSSAASTGRGCPS